MIEAVSLTRLYGAHAAVEGVTFSVGQGEVLGLLGPNGAGKTTILKILSTQIVPTSGQARVMGADVLKEPDRVRALIGYLPEVLPLYDQMEVEEYLSFVAEARGLRGAQAKKRMDFVREALSLEYVWHHPIAYLSKGYRQRVGLAQAIVHDPPVLILDEPTTGLDPLQVLEIRDLIRQMAREKAVIFSSHILSEVEAVSDRIAILNQGHLVAQGSLRQLARAAGWRRIFRLRAKERLREALEALPGLEPVSETQDQKGLWTYRALADDKIRIEEVLETLKDRGLNLLEFCEEHPGLEEIFIALVRESHGAG
ncbi:ATP-binding cassette domain-containing protein [Thermosulfuriphilus ammonigenes]|uniref:ATP-binding cassette domain-containing protein n=1 Tax=Thermosulfuriphilus ammonigenes TaxID=1936021 RepID=A0A6G7PU65_9BACT|nr:ATP-binding cassette domain-containing protein [Thermosulfuriphilus ammonigenes]MBA2848705.1 ABC-2 type transport system ATP-binding protein [Thermosulfuriphilus ammonigenes]QIJ71160.1 ATP-binding cassette domain-containing protein [Thermosulfuriphilus ammonigenes]HFB83169.1 ATP-binding cassette domain-containing protein [Thermodesulfatator sp.]